VLSTYTTKITRGVQCWGGGIEAAEEKNLGLISSTLGINLLPISYKGGSLKAPFPISPKLAMNMGWSVRVESSNKDDSDKEYVLLREGVGSKNKTVFQINKKNHLSVKSKSEELIKNGFGYTFICNVQDGKQIGRVWYPTKMETVTEMWSDGKAVSGEKRIFSIKSIESNDIKSEINGVSP
jgi:hypothetical protein